MSPHDAVNVVFKCMLRGAVDFLVKPVRKNELRNLWQHVWRRHSLSSDDISHHNGNPSQQIPQPLDQTSSTKYSSYCIASPKENNDYSEKGADAQSSCTKSDMQDDTAGIRNMPTLSELKFMTVPSVDSMRTIRVGDSFNVDDVLLMKENEVEDKSRRLVRAKTPYNQSNYSRALIPKKEEANSKRLTKGKNPESETHREDANIQINPFDEQLKPSTEAMDLIGSIDNHLQEYTTHFQQVLCNTLNIYFDLNNTRNTCSSNPQLELSLRRSEFCDNEIKGVVEVQELKHSNASAFSRYNQQTVQPPVCIENEGVSLLVSCNNQSDHAFSHIAEVPQHGVISFPLPVRSTGADSYGAVWPQLFYTPVGPSGKQSSNCATQQSNRENRDYQPFTCKSTNLTHHKQRHNVQSLDDLRHVSVATTQTVTSSLCNSSSSNINSSGCGSCDGSNGNETTVTTVEATTGSEIDIGVSMHDEIKGTDSYCSSQSCKFRMKRKDRCFEKKEETCRATPTSERTICSSNP
ncbi:Two-component response regulator-like [Thalictrum thalictroides]|uniref:Two-component response regulator-like n=1 Tax=Thalictrum thalictroides TaxID=46969 RepID=A0A7J6W807_THATH|nr:Two-component response regulator-like [Thalictrum thalictroides]